MAKDPEDPFGPEYFTDPYPSLARLREQAPVFRSERLRRWVVTRHAEALTVLRNPDRFSSRVIPQIPPTERFPALETFIRLSERWLFFQDPPEHTRERAPVARCLAPRAMAPLEPQLRSAAERRHADLIRQGGGELIAEYAHPLAVEAILALLAGEPAEAEALRRWCRAIEAASLAPRDRPTRRAGFESLAAAALHLQGRVADSFRPLPRFPAGLRGLEPEAVCAHSLVLLLAGVETTQNLIANTVYELLARPDQLQALREEPALIPAAVEEGLRYQVPVLGVLRRAAEPVRLGGQSIAAGEELVVFLGAADRDPTVFPHPDRFDIRRAPGPNLGFGYGIHYCPGAPLARLTARVALEVLLRGPLAAAGEVPEWRRHDPIVRGLRRLPVRMQAGG